MEPVKVISLRDKWLLSVMKCLFPGCLANAHVPRGAGFALWRVSWCLQVSQLTLGERVFVFPSVRFPDFPFLVLEDGTAHRTVYQLCL